MDVNVDYNDGRVSQLLHYSYVVRYSTRLDSTRFDLGRYLYPFDILRSNGQIKCSLWIYYCFFPFCWGLTLDATLRRRRQRQRRSRLPAHATKEKENELQLVCNGAAPSPSLPLADPTPYGHKSRYVPKPQPPHVMEQCNGFWLIAKLNTRRRRASGPAPVQEREGRGGGQQSVCGRVQCTASVTYLVQWPRRSSAWLWPGNSSGSAGRLASSACDRSSASADTAAARAARGSACRRVWRPVCPGSEREREGEMISYWLSITDWFIFVQQMNNWTFVSWAFDVIDNISVYQIKVKIEVTLSK